MLIHKQAGADYHSDVLDCADIPDRTGDLSHAVHQNLLSVDSLCLWVGASVWLCLCKKFSYVSV